MFSSFAKSSPQVGDLSTGYELTIGGFSSWQVSYDAFEAINGATFATTDYSALPALSGCAAQQGGAWWYNTFTCGVFAWETCNACLNQSPSYQWTNGGITDYDLTADSMTLVCKI